MKENNMQLRTMSNRDDLLDKDVWKVEELGLNPSFVNSLYQLNFSKLSPLWFKQAVKKFVRFQSTRNSLSSCRSYIVQLIHFGTFLNLHHEGITPEKIDRRICVKFIEYLSQLDLSISTRITVLIHLRTFHQIMMQENWLPWSNIALIYSSDFPKRAEHIPRFIPESVLSQLQQNLYHLPEYTQRLINLLLETGRRISEICSLPFDCLELDDEKDAFLKVDDKKLKKSYLIPISLDCTKLIKEQQKYALKDADKQQQILYLFPSRRSGRTPHVAAPHIRKVLDKLAEKYSIKDVNGKLWHFHPHQFRHTVGTRMINAGVSQVIVQRYLGHESPEMTARYAHIHDETLKAAFHSYQSRLIDIHGKEHRVGQSTDDAKWLQYNMMAQALPNGICGLPSPQQRCPHANACLNCAHFCTNKQFLPQHRTQLEATNKIIKAAKTNGWQRQLEMNIAVKENLEKIIISLEEENRGD